MNACPVTIFSFSGVEKTKIVTGVLFTPVRVRGADGALSGPGDVAVDHQMTIGRDKVASSELCGAKVVTDVLTGILSEFNCLKI